MLHFSVHLLPLQWHLLSSELYWQKYKPKCAVIVIIIIFIIIINIIVVIVITVLITVSSNSGPGSSVGIATDYVLDGPGLNPRGDEIFRHSRPALGDHPASFKMRTGSFPGIKYGRGVLLTTYPLLVPWSWKSRAIPPPTPWATPGL